MQQTSSVSQVLPKTRPLSARCVYFDLFDGQAAAHEINDAAGFLSAQLMQAARLDSDLPQEMGNLGAWMQQSVERVGRQYREYLEARSAGAGRCYFANKSHALYFLKAAAPTKMVDGAWLYGLLPRWQDTRFASLIQTYLEELGEGLAAKNHVVLYKKLLAAQGCERWDDLSDHHYVQGAIQLALAYHADRFLPELIGFNLGYEQLPLHLLITAYELKELGIDPYYFTLHITVDNADSGHAKKAVDAILDTLPRLGDAREWYRRVQNGYKLNLLGACTNSIIADFELEQELHAIFSRKGAIGQYAHSDYRQVEGRTVNDWLSDGAKVGDFVAAMEHSGWFKRHQDPQNSRFWKLIQSEKAKMFGVFSAYEQQVIYDWIVGNAAAEFPMDARVAAPRRQFPFEANRRRDKDAKSATATAAAALNAGDFDAEVRELEEKLASVSTHEAAMTMLIGLMSPAHHHSAAGLMATRIFNDAVA